MPRTSKPWFRVSSNTWVSRVNGQLHTLAKGRGQLAEAKRRLRAIHSVVQPQSQECAQLGVGELTDRYLTWAQGNLAPRTVEVIRWHLGLFNGHMGQEHPAAAVTVMDVLRWVDSRGWNATTRSDGISIVGRCWRWGKRVGLLADTHLVSIPQPPRGRRETAPTSDEIANLIEQARGQHLKELLLVLKECGPRPSEIIRATPEMLGDGRRTIVIPKGKTTRKTGKPRVIYLTHKATRIITRRIDAGEAKRFLFTNAKHGQWGKSALSQRLCEARERGGLGPHVTPYGIRHWWITEQLRKGTPIAIIAELAGTSTRMIERHYGHLSQHGETLMAWLEKGA